MRVLRPLFIFIFFLSLLACGGSLSKKQISSIQTVGIVNQFPDYPTYAQVKVAIGKQTYPTVNDIGFKRTLMHEVSERVRQQGYLVKENFDGDVADVDLLIEIVPGEVNNLINSFAYGFYHRSLLGVMSSSHSYVALTLVTTLKGDLQCDDCVGESVSELSVQGWRSNWVELPRTEKKKLEDALNFDIRKAVENAFSQTGL